MVSSVLASWYRTNHVVDVRAAPVMLLNVADCSSLWVAAHNGERGLGAAREGFCGLGTDV